MKVGNLRLEVGWDRREAMEEQNVAFAGIGVIGIGCQTYIVVCQSSCGCESSFW